MRYRSKTIKKPIRIGKRLVGEGRPVFIIAEAGVNHNGSLRTAKRMVTAAKETGADAIKFQTFIAEDLVTITAPKAEYQMRRSRGRSQYEMLKSLELSEKDFVELEHFCREQEMVFLSTPFELSSAELLNRLRVPAFKISSGELTNLPLLKKIAAFGKPIILSTGMSNLKEIKEAVEEIYAEGNRQLILLHCTSNYPTKLQDVNLRAMGTMRRAFNVPVGYSDHTPGIDIAVAAAALGACLIEKHFTLNRGLPGPDHQASLEPKELQAMVKAIRSIEQALGNGIKQPTRAEKEMIKYARKSIVALYDIGAGDKLSLDNLIVKRPGIGIEPKYINELVGKSALSDIKKDKIVTWREVR